MLRTSCLILLVTDGASWLAQVSSTKQWSCKKVSSQSDSPESPLLPPTSIQNVTLFTTTAELRNVTLHTLFFSCHKINTNQWYKHKTHKIPFFCGGFDIWNLRVWPQSWKDIPEVYHTVLFQDHLSTSHEDGNGVWATLLEITRWLIKP